MQSQRNEMYNRIATYQLEAFFPTGTCLENIAMDSSYRENLDPANHDFTAADLIEQLDRYIVTRVTREMTHNPAFAHSPSLDLEIDDVVQQIRIKLWYAVQKQVLRSPRAYIARMISTTLVDLLRSREPTFRLFLDEEGEPYAGYPFIEPGEGMDDPEYEVSQEATLRELLVEILHHLQTFPLRQQVALLGALRERIDDLESLDSLLQRMGFPQTAFTKPEDIMPRHQLKPSLSAARRRLAQELSSSSNEPSSGTTHTFAPTENLRRTRDRVHMQKAHAHPIDQHAQRMISSMNEEVTNKPPIDITQFETLPEPSRTAIRLRYIEHLPYDQIADRLHIPQGTLRAQVSRGMKRLRSSHTPSETLSLQHTGPDLMVALEQLREPYRTVLALHYLEHLTYPQMAQQLHCPLGTVKSLVSRANKLLRQHVSPEQNADIAHGPV